MTNYHIFVSYIDANIFDLGSVDTELEAKSIIEELTKGNFIVRAFCDGDENDEDRDKYKLEIEPVEERTKTEIISEAIGYIDWVESDYTGTDDPWDI